MDKELVKIEQLKFAKWLNKKNMVPSIFNFNDWICNERRNKITKESMVYTTEQLFDEYELCNKFGI